MAAASVSLPDRFGLERDISGDEWVHRFANGLVIHSEPLLKADTLRTLPLGGPQSTSRCFWATLWRNRRVATRDWRTNAMLEVLLPRKSREGQGFGERNPLVRAGVQFGDGVQLERRRAA